MKAAHLFEKKIIVRDINEPKINDDEDVKIKIAYCSICGYDMMVYNGTASSEKNGIVGHEASGVVVECGKAVTSLKPGDNVVISLFSPCGICEECRNNRPVYCVNPYTESSSMREYVVCHQNSVQKLGNVSLKEGCLIEPLTLAIHATSKVRIGGGEKVLILGGGAMGNLLLKTLALTPVGSIAIADPHHNKREMALSFGADAAFDSKDDEFIQKTLEFSGSLGYDVVIEASGNQASAKTAFHFLSRGGRLLFFGLYGMDFELPINLFNVYWKDAQIMALYPDVNLYPKAINMAPKIRLSDIITAEFPLEEAPQAFGEKATGRHCKVLIRVS